MDPVKESAPAGAETICWPTARRWSSVLLLLLCCWHAGFLLYSIIPAPAAHDDPGHPALDFYRTMIGGKQRWNMFDTIPVLSAMEMRIEGVDRNGGPIIVGCVLPGFTPYPTHPESARYYNAFYRLLLANETVPFREAYLRKVARLLPEQPLYRDGRDWAVVADQHYTRNIYHSRRGGPLSVLVTKTFEISEPAEAAPAP